MAVPRRACRLRSACIAREHRALLLPKTPSVLVGADAWVRPMLRAMAAGGALVRPGERCGMVIGRAAATGLSRVTNVFALLRLRPVSSPDKDAEILVLRHQFSV